MQDRPNATKRDFRDDFLPGQRRQTPSRFSGRREFGDVQAPSEGAPQDGKTDPGEEFHVHRIS